MLLEYYRSLDSIMNKKLQPQLIRVSKDEKWGDDDANEAGGYENARDCILHFLNRGVENRM